MRTLVRCRWSSGRVICIDSSDELLAELTYGRPMSVSAPNLKGTVRLESSSGRMRALDGIRGLAIIWVVLHNTTDLLPPTLHGASHVLAFLVHPGWIGVQLFFALSGFLITGSLLDTQRATHYFLAFYARRALRILPLYYAVLILLLIVAPALHLGPALLQANPKEQLSLWLFAVNWTHTAPYGFAHFWSLAIEEQFYLFWPFIVYRLSARRLFAVCLYIAVIGFFIRGVMVFSGASSWTVYTATTSRLDALALGGAGACLVRIPAARAWLASRLTGVNLAALALFVVGVPATRAYDTDAIQCQLFGYTLLALCCAILVTTAAAGEQARPTSLARILCWAPLRSCGKYSYAIYIFHQLINKLWGEPWMATIFGSSPPAHAVYLYSLTIGLVSFGVAYLSYQLLEKHFLKLKILFPPQGDQAHNSANP
jgi:peptidoglycan/LPS O-acetylase OafA/YrhL